MTVSRHQPLVLLGVLLSTTSSFAETKDVQYTSAPIQTSGDISQFTPASKLFDLSGQSSNNTATYYAMWDRQNLYFGVDVKDTSLYCNAMGADSQVAWANDSVELNFDLKNKKTLSPGDQDFRQWIFPTNYNNNTYDAYGTGDTADTSFTGTATVGFKLSGTLNDATADTGYTAIIAIPWADLALTAANNLSFGFDGAVNDRDDLTGEPTWADWAKLSVFAQPDKWNALRLTGGPNTPNPDGSVAPTDSYVPTADWFIGNPDSGTPPVNNRPSDDFSCDCGVGHQPGHPLQPVLGCIVLGLLLCRRKRKRP